MIENKTLVKSFEVPPVSLREVTGYALSRGDGETVGKIAEAVLAELPEIRNGRAVYRTVPVIISGESVSLGGIAVESSGLAKALQCCRYAVIMAVTAGIEFDRLIAKYSAISGSRAHIISAVGSERVEAMADAFCLALNGEFSEEGYSLTSRFSPGYGDFSLEFQRCLFSLLTPEKYIGLYLNESLLMSPSKSVTAIIGVKEK